MSNIHVDDDKSTVMLLLSRHHVCLVEMLAQRMGVSPSAVIEKVLDGLRSSIELLAMAHVHGIDLGDSIAPVLRAIAAEATQQTPCRPTQWEFVN